MGELRERCNTSQAVLICGIHKRTLQEKAAAGLIPGARKTFGRWTFDVAMLRKLGTGSCQKVSLRETAFTGRVSRSKASNTARAYEHALNRSR